MGWDAIGPRPVHGISAWAAAASSQPRRRDRAMHGSHPFCQIQRRAGSHPCDYCRQNHQRVIIRPDHYAVRRGHGVGPWSRNYWEPVTCLSIHRTWLVSPGSKVSGGLAAAFPGSGERARTSPAPLAKRRPRLTRGPQFEVSFCSTLRILSSIVCDRSMRVPKRRLDEIRGAPMACTTS